MMTRYTDEFIEYWGTIFVDDRLRRRLGITFERFLANPRRWLRDASLGLCVSRTRRAITREDINDGCDPLLPGQRTIANRVALEPDETTAVLRRIATGMSTAADAEYLARKITAARTVH